MDNSLKTKEKPTGSGGLTPPAKHKPKTFPIGKELKTKDLRQTAAERGKRDRIQTTQTRTRIAAAKGRVKPLARLLRCATALRVTAPLGCGSGVWYGRKVPFGPSTRPEPHLSPREQRVSPDRPAAVQSAKRRSVPLTARTNLELSRARGKGGGCRRDWTNGLLALVNRTARHFRNIFAAAILALRL